MSSTSPRRSPHECLSTPINMVFQSTAPYNTTTGDVTLVAANYTIPDFGGVEGTLTMVGIPNSCGIAQGAPDISLGLNDGVYPDGVAGSTNNNTTLNLQGTGLPIPPPPAKPTTNSLSASPVSPQLITTPVTLTDTISSDGTPATAATGVVNFLANGVVVGTQPVSGGTATFTTTALPNQTNQLTAMYSGDLTYASSTSAPVPYAMQPLPSVTMSLPTTVELSSPDPNPVLGHRHQPRDGCGLEQRSLPATGVRRVGANKADITLDYQDSAGNWCPLIPNGIPTAQALLQRLRHRAVRHGGNRVLPGPRTVAHPQPADLHRLRPDEPDGSHGPGPGAGQSDPLQRELLEPNGPRYCSQSNSPFNNYILPTNSGAPETERNVHHDLRCTNPGDASIWNIPTYAIPQGYDLEPLNDLRAPRCTLKPGR